MDGIGYVLAILDGWMDGWMDGRGGRVYKIVYYVNIFYIWPLVVMLAAC
jgi:hypothetical protein